MKKVLLLLMTLCLSTMPCIKSMAYDYAIENDQGVTIYYNNDSSHSGNTLYVTYAGTSYSNVKNSYTGDVVIPATVTIDGEEWTIRGIVQNCFRGCTELTSVVLPNTMTTFGSSSSTYGFYGCTVLTTVTIPNQVQSIPDYTFYGCSLLTKVTYDGAEDSDEAVQLPATVNAINEYAFRGCSSLTGPLTLPSTMNYIDAGAFYQCTGLTSVTVEASDNPLYVENSANYSPFYQCNGLEIVYLYRDCENVKSINNSTSHNYGLFRVATSTSSTNSTGMKTIYIGKDVTKISPYCFHTNRFVEKVIFEEGSKLETIDNYAFYQSVGYGSGNSTAVVEGSTVYIPDGVKEIGTYAFYQDYGLENVVFGEDSKLETINGYSFASCSNITEFTIPHNVTSVGQNVWNGCKALRKIHILNPEPMAVVSNDFSSDGDYDYPLVIYVPYGSEEKYEESSWGTIAVAGSGGKIIFNSSVVEIDALDASGVEDYASYYHPYALTIPDGVKAYAISSFSSDGTLTMTEVTDVIPQHSAVLLERDASTETSSYRIYIAEDDEHTAISSNLLYGSEQSTTTSVDGVTDGYYFYGLTTKNGENLGFYWGAENGAAFTIPANKAWLALPSAEATNISYLKLKKDGNTTGIESIEATETANNGAIYTLQGVRVNDMSQKGIYIVNGKKVLVK